MNDELARARMNRAENSYGVDPVDLLRGMALDIERGVFKCDGLLVLWADRPEGGPWYFGAYRSRMKADEELTVLEIAKARLMKRWIFRDE